MIRFELALLALLLPAVSIAAPPADMARDPVLRDWFHSLLQPGTQHLCCDVSDCHFVEFRIRDGHYEVEIEGWRYVVQPSLIIPGITNPTGKGVACYTYGVFQPPPPPEVPRDRPQDIVDILCFVPPRPPS